MDRIYGAQETTQYEAWLETAQGRDYVRSSNLLIDNILDCQPGWRVLDVGCGLGSHMAHFVERGMLTHGLEAGPMIAKLAGRRLGHKATITVGNAQDLPFEDNEFDAVVLINTLELTDRRAQVLAEACRVAASRVCVVSANALDPLHRLRRWGGRASPLHWGRALSLYGLRRLVREVLGPVPMFWGAAQAWPLEGVGRLPWGALVGLCAAVTPRIRTRPLIIQPNVRPIKAKPVAGAGRVGRLRCIK